VFGIRSLVNPSYLAGLDVECQDASVTFGNIHNPIGDDRRRNPSTLIPYWITPDRTQSPDVRAVNLRERTETVDVESSPIAQPVTGSRVEQSLFGNRLPGRRSQLHARRRRDGE